MSDTSCHCRATPLPADLITNSTFCATPCLGDSTENCGDAKYVIQTSRSSCISGTEFEFGNVYNSPQIGQAFEMPIEAEGKSILISMDYGDGTGIQNVFLQQIRPHLYTVPGDYVVSAFSSSLSNVSEFSRPYLVSQ